MKERSKEDSGGGSDRGNARAVAIPLWRKILFGALFTGAGLLLVELASFLLLHFLPGYDPAGVNAFRHVNNTDGERSLFMTSRMANELDGLLDETILFNLMGNLVTHPDAELIFKVRPDVGEIEGIGDLGINSMGFRGKEFDLEDKSAKRVMVIGDSCAFGWWIFDMAQTWTSRLERLLEAELGKAEVFNLGQPGYSTFQCALLFDRWFDRIRPDYLVIYAGWNDLHGATITDKQTAEILSRTMTPATMWLRRSFTFELIEQSMMRYRVARVEAKGKMSAGTRRVPAEEGVANFEKMVDRAGATGCKVVVVMPPFSAERAPDKPNGFGNMLAYREEITERVRSKALVAIFREMEYDQPDSVRYFVEGDGYHPDPDGARIIATGLAQAILQIEKERSPGASRP